MTRLLTQLAHDDAGFVVSSELVLVATITVIGMVVGLAEIGTAVNQELEDVASAFGSVNQSFEFKAPRGCKAKSTGSCFHDKADDCDDDCDLVASKPRGEKGHEDHHGGGSESGH